MKLSCEYTENPLGLDTPEPRLTWILASDERDQIQTAYRILVASTREKLEADQGDLWDTGKVSSNETVLIGYQGENLRSGQRCYWKVRVWDGRGEASDWSEPASWEMGLLSRDDWQATWIGRTTDIEERPAPMFRREFELNGNVRSARLYIAGLGYHEVQLNGEKVGDHLLDPGFTRYDKRVLYVTHDVTAQLNTGANAIGVILGHGWFNPQTKAVWNFHEAPWREAPKLLLSLAIEYEDGRREVIGSDETWKTATGPIVFNSIYGGEIYDARLEKTGWDRSGYDDAEWDAVLAVEAPKGTLVAQTMPPIRATNTIKPVKITEPKPGIFIVDMGQNFAGHAVLRVEGPAGTEVTMRYAERLHEDGTLDAVDMSKHVRNMDASQQFQTDTYILKGEGVETYHSRFTYHGYQYVELTGFPGEPTLETLEGVFIHSDVPAVGHFESSNPLFSWITTAARWAYLSNLHGYPTDCPHREKNGWMGDAHLAAEQAIYAFNPAPVYAKWINDIGDEQRPSGEVPGIVPTSGWGYQWGNGPAWDSAFLLIPYYLYEYYGDERVLTDHYDGMKRYVDYLESRAEDGIINFGLNDWAPHDTQTPTDITSTAYYYKDVQIVASTAALLGRSDEAEHYSQLAFDIKEAFNDKFYNPETGIYGTGSQTALSCALYQGLVEPENRARVLENLVAAVEARGGHIDTGILGAKYILHALTDGGRADVAYEMANKTDRPGWGWWKAQGATTLWEQWNGTESRNHIMFGDIVAWFYRSLAGIGTDPESPGFENIIVRPQPVGDLTFARAETESIRGTIESGWEIRDGRFELRVMIPANSTATVYVPDAAPEQVTEGGKPAAESPGVKSARALDGDAIFEIGSGTYRFSAPRG